MINNTRIPQPFVTRTNKPVEVGRAPDGDQAVGVGELGKHPDLVVVLKIGTNHRHTAMYFLPPDIWNRAGDDIFFNWQCNNVQHTTAHKKS